MKCKILFSWKNKKNIISLLPAESAHSVVSGHTNHRNTGKLPKYQNTHKNIGTCIPVKDNIKGTNIGFN